MHFRIEQRIDAPLGEVENLLLDPTFVAASSQLPKLDDCEVLDKEQRERKVHLRIHRRFAGELSRAVTTVLDPSKLTWVEDIVYDLEVHGGSHRIQPEHYPDRIRCEYTTSLDAEGDRTIRVTEGTLEVKAFLASGPVERAIVSGLREYAAAEADLLANWEPT